MSYSRTATFLMTLAAAAVAYAAVTIDVLVAYDQSAARWLAGNNVDGQTLASDTIGTMNSFLPATELDKHFTFRLVGTMFSAAEATGADSTARLHDAINSVADGETGKPSGLWKDIQTARETYKADVVLVLVDVGDESSGLGGISWGMGKEALSSLSEFAPWAYSVCRVQLACKYGVVAHEVGHVMGA